MTSTSPASGPVLYVIACGSPAARHVPDIVTQAQTAGWRVCVVPTPMGAKFLDTQQLESLTGHPVRTDYKEPNEPDVLPPADAYIVAPATFNTVNKLAAGITDTLALGLVCEGLGYGRPVIVVPWFNRALVRHGAYRRSLTLLQNDGASVVLIDETRPEGSPVDDGDGKFPLPLLMAALDRANSAVKAL